jgi:hypothetical protein
MVKDTSLNQWAARLLATGMLAAALAACGGGGGTDGCASLDPTRNTALPGCPGTTSGGGVTSSATLDVSPNGATANVGDSVNFRVSGGAPGYTLTVNNPSIATVAPGTVASNGGTFTATLRNVGITTVAVVDGLGQTRTFTLTVNEASALLRLSPARLTVSESLLDPIALTIHGGTGPYRAYTSDQEKSSVSITGSILTIGLGTTGTRCFPAVYPDQHATYDVTLTVLDSVGASATSVMSIQDNMPGPVCP